MSAPVQPPAPRAALVTKVDTLGDLVLFAPALRALRAAWPGTRLVVAIRRGYLDLAPALAPDVEWLPTTLDPFAHGPDRDPAELQRIQDVVTALAPTVVAAATSRRNWLEVLLAATAPSARRVALGAEDDSYFGTQLRLRFGVDAGQAFGEHLPVPAEEPDWQRNFRLVDALLGRAVERQPPTLTPAPASVAAADAVLRPHGLERGRYVVCAAAGFANVALKTWPADRFAAALRFLHERHGLRALLVGHAAESDHLECVRALAAGAPAVWLGGDGGLPTLAGLIAGATLYLGNDTGALHLAGALDVPVAGVYGGGTWPRFAPAGRRSVAVVQPLPCFGCGWDCAFGDAPCLGGIAIDDVIGALEFALAARTTAYAELRLVERLPAVAREIMGQAAANYRQLRAAHHARQQEFENTVALAAERNVEINAKEAEIRALKSACVDRDNAIIILNRNILEFSARYDALHGEKAQLDQTLARLPPDAAAKTRVIHDQGVH